MAISFRAGRLPPHPEATHLRVKLGDHLYVTPVPPTPPASVDWHSDITVWPIYGNTDWGDCVEAEIGHHEEVLSTYGAGTLVEVADADVLAVYEAITGFDPAAGPPGANPTDTGTNIQDALGYWTTTGIAGHKIAAFAQVDYTTDEWRTALALFGPLTIGVNLSASAQQQFSAGEPWDVVADDGGILGGHCVAVVGYDPEFVYVVTWGAVQKVTPAWWATYVEEAWAPVSTEWVNARSGDDPAGVDLVALGEEFAEITGAANPFPQPTPPPVPIPQQGLLDELVALIRADIGKVEDWLTSHGL